MFTRFLRWSIAVPAAIAAAMAAHAVIMLVGRASFTYATMDFEREGLLALFSELCLRLTAAGATGMCFIYVGTAVAPDSVPRRVIALGLCVVLILLMGVTIMFMLMRREWLEIAFAAFTGLGGIATYLQVRRDERTAAAAAGVAY